MRAFQLRHPGPIAGDRLVAVEIADPLPGRGDLLLKVTACAVCRTDLQQVLGDLPAHRIPVIPGHQVVGRVIGLGPGASGWAIGDRAGVGWLAGSCGTCRFCTSRRENLCVAAAFTGWDRDGGYAAMTTVRADFAIPLPGGFTDLQAAPLLCGGVIGFRALKESGIQPGGKLGLYGFGASALLALQVALHWGCEVFVITRSDAEKRRALEMGAVWAGGYSDLPPSPLEAAVTFAPSGDVVVAALRAVDRGGTVAVNAIHLDRIPEFAYELLWWERRVRSIANYTREDADEFLALAAQIPIHTTVDAYPLADVNKALQRLEAGQVAGAAVLVV
jgi:propanol-preferring alcohol dehydrogenase